MESIAPISKMGGASSITSFSVGSSGGDEVSLDKLMSAAIKMDSAEKGRQTEMLQLDPTNLADAMQAAQINLKSHESVSVMSKLTGSLSNGIKQIITGQ